MMWGKISNRKKVKSVAVTVGSHTIQSKDTDLVVILLLSAELQRPS